MQFATLISATAALIASVSADAGGGPDAVQLNAGFDSSQPYAQVTNQCGYPVYIWSVFKGEGCPTTNMVTLNTGSVYHENLQNSTDGVTGRSIKMSKSTTCGGSDISQLEYFRQWGNYGGNYLDMSFIDCPGGNCPGLKDGYSLVAGSQTGAFVSAGNNKICPVISCTDAASCAKVSYMQPNDEQTRNCDNSQNLKVTLCSGSSSSAGDSSSASSAVPASSAVQSSAIVKVNAAAVTAAPSVADAVGQNIQTKVEIVYVTAVEYVHAKRHAHGHARRHQAFHA